MEILSTKMSDCTSDGTDAIVTVLNKKGKQIDVHVHTFDGRCHRNSYGSLYGNGDSRLDENAFDDYENDIEKIIKEAERFIRATYKIESIQVHFNYVFKIFENRVTLAILNREFISVEETPEKIEYKDIWDFKNIEEAKEFIVDRLEYDHWDKE